MKIVASILAANGLLLLGYGAAGSVSARWYQFREAQRFASRPGAVSGPEIRTPPAGSAEEPEPLPGAAIGRIDIPSVGLSEMVIEGADKSALKLGPGHVPGTAMPGSGGNIVLAGHRDTFFRPLRFLRRGDPIEFTTVRGRYRYRVVATEVVEPSEIRVLYPSAHEKLTLVTCYPFGFVGAAPRRFVVHADCIEPAHDDAQLNR